MNRTEFIVALAIILFVAFVFGWFANWLVHRFSRVTSADLGEIDKMTKTLHDAEEARDQAIAYLKQREAELCAAMEGLREARREAEELRAYVERAKR